MRAEHLTPARIGVFDGDNKVKAVVVENFGPPDVLLFTEADKPKRGSGEILVKVQAVTVNPLDTVLRKGIPMGAYTPTLPYIPGFGIAGIVTESDDDSKFKKGERVWGTKHGAGGYAEYAVYKENELEALPPGLSFNQGAIIDTPFRTSYWSLFDLGEATPGDTVIITGAGGSVGYACVQVAKDANLKVIAICGRRDLEKVLSIGADAAFDYKQPDLRESIAKYLSGGLAQLFIDVAAVQNAKLASSLLDMGGRHVVVGPGGNSPIEVDPFSLIAKGLKICGVALYASSIERHVEISKAISDGLSRGVFHTLEPEQLPLQDARYAHEMLEAGKNSGKLVLVVN